MNDDQTDVKLEGGEEAATTEPSTEEIQATEEAETPVAEPTGTETEQTETESEPKKGANSRIRELNAKAKNEAEGRARAEAEAKSLKDKLAELTAPVGAAPQGQYYPQVNPGQDVTPEQYQQHVYGTANTIVDLRIKQSEAVNRINNEAGEVIRQYPQLDPKSDKYDAELSEAVTEATLAHIKEQPYTASPKAFVEKLMKPYTRSVTKEVGNQTANLAKQVAESAARPTAVSPKGGKDFEDMSVEELRESLGVFHH